MVTARQAIESTYDGVLSVTEHKKVKDEVTKLTTYEDVLVLDDCPCKVSYEHLQSAVSGDSAVTITQIVKLFLSPDVAIKPGSKITVTQAGAITDYTHSGVPAAYPTHQEIVLDLFKRWS